MAGKESITAIGQLRVLSDRNRHPYFQLVSNLGIARLPFDLRFKDSYALYESLGEGPFEEGKVIADVTFKGRLMRYTYGKIVYNEVAIDEIIKVEKTLQSKEMK